MSDVEDDIELIRGRLNLLQVLARHATREVASPHFRAAMDMEMIGLEHNVATLRTHLGLPGGALVERLS